MEESHLFTSGPHVYRIIGQQLCGRVSEEVEQVTSRREHNILGRSEHESILVERHVAENVVNEGREWNDIHVACYSSIPGARLEDEVLARTLDGDEIAGLELVVYTAG